MATEEQLIEKDTALERLLFLSDGVFAIAITLLVLEIIPYITESHTQAGVLAMINGLWGKIITYVISFILVSIYWITHQNMFRYIKRANNVLIWLNILYLMSIAFLPVSTIVLGDSDNQPPAVAFYAGSLVITGLFIILIWWYASSRHKLVDKRLDPLLIREHVERSLIAPIIFLLSIGIAFLQPLLAELTWLLIGVILFIHLRIYHRRRMAAQQTKLSTPT